MTHEQTIEVELEALKASHGEMVGVILHIACALRNLEGIRYDAPGDSTVATGLSQHVLDSVGDLVQKYVRLRVDARKP